MEFKFNFSLSLLATLNFLFFPLISQVSFSQEVSPRFIPEEAAEDSTLPGNGNISNEFTETPLDPNTPESTGDGELESPPLSLSPPPKDPELRGRLGLNVDADGRTDAEFPQTIDLKTTCFKSKTWDSFEEFYAHNMCDELRLLLSLSPHGVHFSNLRCRQYRDMRQAIHVGCAKSTNDYLVSPHYGAVISPKIILKEKKEVVDLFSRQVSSHRVCMMLKSALESLSTNKVIFIPHCTPSSNERLPYTIGAEIHFNSMAWVPINNKDLLESAARAEERNAVVKYDNPEIAHSNLTTSLEKLAAARINYAKEVLGSRGQRIYSNAGPYEANWNALFNDWKVDVYSWKQSVRDWKESVNWWKKNKPLKFEETHFDHWEETLNIWEHTLNDWRTDIDDLKANWNN